MNSEFRLIAHRGNLTGPCEHENAPEYLKETLNDGFDVEVDVWFNGRVGTHYYDGLWLGHDKPQHRIDMSFLEDKRVWTHAKNVEAFEVLLKNSNVHCFWHQNDDYALTSQGYVWTYPDKPLTTRSIAVKLSKGPDDYFYLRKLCMGVCSDWLK